MKGKILLLLAASFLVVSCSNKPSSSEPIKPSSSDTSEQSEPTSSTPSSEPSRESSSSSEYSSTKQCSDFTVDGKKIIRVKLESAKVPNTAAGAYKGFYYIGSLLLLVGIGVVTTLLFKEKHKVKTTE